MELLVWGSEGCTQGRGTTSRTCAITTFSTAFHGARKSSLPLLLRLSIELYLCALMTATRKNSRRKVRSNSCHITKQFAGGYPELLESNTKTGADGHAHDRNPLSSGMTGQARQRTGATCYALVSSMTASSSCMHHRSAVFQCVPRMQAWTCVAVALTLAFLCLSRRGRIPIVVRPTLVKPSLTLKTSPRTNLRQDKEPTDLLAR